MKKFITVFTLCSCIISILLISSCSSCGSSDNKSDGAKSNIDLDDKLESDSPLPLNISVYLDLSDRLTRELTPSQIERDTAIINHLVHIFINDCITNGKIINSTNHFQVFFYPAPNSSEIAQLAKGLNVDLAKCQAKDKKINLMNMKTKFQNNISQIYSDAINEQKWVGSDIWGFFSNRIVDTLCIRKGYRNILVILTDGYLFSADNKIKEGNAYSYVLPQTLAIEGASLLAKRNGLENLEVLMLEVNPYTPKQHDALVSVLEKWFNEMGVNKFQVSETALPVNTEIYIDSFINE